MPYFNNLTLFLLTIIFSQTVSLDLGANLTLSAGRLLELNFLIPDFHAKKSYISSDCNENSQGNFNCTTSDNCVKTKNTDTVQYPTQNVTGNIAYLNLSSHYYSQNISIILGEDCIDPAGHSIQYGITGNLGLSMDSDAIKGIPQEVTKVSIITGWWEDAGHEEADGFILFDEYKDQFYKDKYGIHEFDANQNWMLEYDRVKLGTMLIKKVGTILIDTNNVGIGIPSDIYPLYLRVLNSKMGVSCIPSLGHVVCPDSADKIQDTPNIVLTINGKELEYCPKAEIDYQGNIRVYIQKTVDNNFQYSTLNVTKEYRDSFILGRDFTSQNYVVFDFTEMKDKNYKIRVYPQSQGDDPLSTKRIIGIVIVVMAVLVTIYLVCKYTRKDPKAEKVKKLREKLLKKRQEAIEKKSNKVHDESDEDYYNSLNIPERNSDSMESNSQSSLMNNSLQTMNSSLRTAGSWKKKGGKAKSVRFADPE